MVALFQRFGHPQKTSSRMKQHHESGALSASFRSFEAQILSHLYQLSLHSKPGAEAYTYSWIQKCLSLVPHIDRAFAKFIVEIDYPVKEWESSVVEEYLKGNLSLLDHLNCISSSISHMSQACMKLTYALSSPVRLNNLQEILPWCSKKRVEEEEEEDRHCSEKERIVHQALLVRKRVKTWLCRVIDSSIRGDVAETCIEMKKESSRFYNSSLGSLQFAICQERKKRGVVKEVGEINKGAFQLHAAAREEARCNNEANILRERAEVWGNLLEGIKEDVNRLFSESMVRRNELLDTLRNRQQDL